MTGTSPKQTDSMQTETAGTSSRIDNVELADIVYGAAVGDAVGVPYEGFSRHTFFCTGMDGYGAHMQPAGTFSDDTSMMLALCDSIRACEGAIDTADMRERFRAWLNQGAYTCSPSAFGVGRTTAIALDQGFGLSDVHSNGNGSLMRTLPLALTNATDSEIAAVSAITHAHPLSEEACVVAVRIARDLIKGKSLEEALSTLTCKNEELSRVAHILEYSQDDISSSGYVVSTLEAALWCLGVTSSYEECVLEAVNLGGDSDTTACVAGAFAGIVYGKRAIPAEWLDDLRGKGVIESCLFA